MPIASAVHPALSGACWVTSSYTNSDSGQCVEVAMPGPIVGVRDTKQRSRGHITVAVASWAALVDRVKSRG